MCGRFALGGIDHEDLFQQLIEEGIIPGDEDHEWVDRDDFHPRYNIAPRSRAPVVRRRREDSNDENMGSPSRDHLGRSSTATQQSDETASPSARRPSTFIHTMRWGVVPHSAKEDTSSTTANTINARVETILDRGGMWLRLVDSKRCIVVCDGYYEWLNKGKIKVAHFVRHPHQSKKLYMAGLWDEKTFEGSAPLFTFSIITVPARPDMEWLHERMPLIFSSTLPEDMERLNLWLDPSKNCRNGILDLLKTYQDTPPSEELTIYQVPPEVGKVGNESPAFIRPIEERKDGIKAMFAKSQQKATTSCGSTEQPSLKRSRSITPEAQTSGGPEKKKPKIETSPKKVAQRPKAPPSPRKKKVEASPTKTINDFFSVISPRKGAQQ